MKTVLDQIAGIPPFPGPGWVHLLSTGTMTPPRITHPLHPQTGFQTVEQWIYVNAEGYGEKNLTTIRDQDGRITQQSHAARRCWERDRLHEYHIGWPGARARLPPVWLPMQR